MKKIFLFIIMISMIFVSCEKEKIGNNIKDHFFLRNNNADMPVYVEGNTSSGIFVIILHGGPGDEILIYKDLLNSFTDELEKNYALVYWGQRCSGSSQGNINTDEIKLSDFVEDLEKLLLLLKHRYGEQIEFFLVGHSWGGALGSLFLLEGSNQQNIQGWIEVDGAHNVPLVSELAKEMIISTGENQIILGNNISSWESLINDAKQCNIRNDDGKIKINQLGDKAIELMADVDSVIYKDVTTGEIINETFFKPFNPFSFLFNGVALHNNLEEYFSLSLSNKLSEISIPSLFIWGKYDFYVPCEVGNDAYNHIGSYEKEIAIFDRSEHWPIRTEPEKCRNVIISFIEKYK